MTSTRPLIKTMMRKPQLKAPATTSTRVWSGFFTAIVAMLCLLINSQSSLAQVDGKAVYTTHCASCHGEKGLGVEGKTANPLIGTLDVDALAQVIDETMPEDDPDKCNAEESKAVAKYVFDKFYSPQARNIDVTAKRELVHLTNDQYIATLADLLTPWPPSSTDWGTERGLKAHYAAKRKTGKNGEETQIDPNVDFDFKDQSPIKEPETHEEFRIRWDGCVLAEETGDYEFAVESENGFKLFVNNGEEPLIDGWVAEAGKKRELSGVIRLVGGRAYFLKLEMFKFKDPSASIALKWKPPFKAMHVIPNSNLSPKWCPSVFICQTKFPADDSVSGYRRGLTISNAWDSATTSAAIEAANYMWSNANKLADVKKEDDDAKRREKIHKLCRDFAGRCLRMKLEGELQQQYVDQFFENNAPLEDAVKRTAILCLKSPRFLYPDITSTDDPGMKMATRLSLAIWDCYPDNRLRDRVGWGGLKTEQQVREVTLEMMKDPRAKTKFREFTHHWLTLDEKPFPSKSETLDKDFDSQAVSDLRTSLDMYVDQIVWSEQSDYRQLMTSAQYPVNARLAKIYGVQKEDIKAFEQLSLDEGARAGLLTHPYVMAAFAYQQESSPIHRGVFVTRRLINRELRSPPEANLFEDAHFDPGMTMREKVSQMTSAANCQTCHRIINPLGFTLEHYDALGRFRANYDAKPVDAATTYVDDDGQEVAFKNARDLAQYIAQSPDAHGAFIDHLFHHTAKQPINSYGNDLREKLVLQFENDNFHIRRLWLEMIVRITMHDASPNTQEVAHVQ
ncbi:DUF1588 domain-containing protein [Lacunimicrobium album]